MDKAQLMKIAHDVPAVLAEGARVTRKLASDNLELAAQNAGLEQSLRIHKLAMRMEERKLEPSLTVTEKVAMLEKISDERRLSGIEAAVEMQAGGFKLADLRVEEDIVPPTTTKLPGEIGSSAHYDSLDQRIQSIG